MAMSLNDDDKQWLRELIGSSEGRHRELLEASEGRYLGLLEASEGRYREGLAELRIELLERLEAVETRLLTEFHKWASPMEARQRAHTAAIRATDLEFEQLEGRVKKLESNPPPMQ
jgi:hypothetical protein